MKARTADEMTAKDLVQHAKQVQDDSKAATGRTRQVLDQTIAVGMETTEVMHAQTKQLNTVDTGLDDLESTLKRADKQVRIFLRRLATDKVVMTLVFVVVIAIVTSIVVSVTQKKLKGETVF